MKKEHGSMGSMPKKGGKDADHGSVGKNPSGGTKNQLDMNSNACGKGVKCEGGNMKYKSPKPKCYAQGPQGKQAGGF